MALRWKLLLHLLRNTMEICWMHQTLLTRQRPTFLPTKGFCNPLPCRCVHGSNNFEPFFQLFHVPSLQQVPSVSMEYELGPFRDPTSKLCLSRFADWFVCTVSCAFVCQETVACSRECLLGACARCEWLSQCSPIVIPCCLVAVRL